MRLVIIHNHFRPGGVRRVIELATPQLARRLRPRVENVVLAAGEAPDEAWLSRLRAMLAPLPITCETEGAFGYLAEQEWRRREVECRIRNCLRTVLSAVHGSDCLVWAHNQGLGRNLLLTREIVNACKEAKAGLVFHHHDWWFENRWPRWPEMRRAGFRTLENVAKAIFNTAPFVRHAVINQADASVLAEHLAGQSGWLPNPVGPQAPPSATGTRRARARLLSALGEKAPVWLMPCRLLRRKNIAEGLLLTRLLRPEAWLVTTGIASSDEEKAYAARLTNTALRNRWRLRLGLLEGEERKQPSVSDLLTASEAVLLTSLQEGFGLPYLEAAAAARPLIARSLPNIFPDLAQFGFEFPQCYEELMVDPSLFDWRTEVRRQDKLFAAWRKQLPGSCRGYAGIASLLLSRDTPQPVAFSRLTLTAQLEVLAGPLERTWEVCAALNPHLPLWRGLAQEGRLRVSAWPKTAEKWLGGAAYARNFHRLIQAPLRERPASAARTRAHAGAAAQREFIRRKLAAENLYPLTWNSET